LTGPFRAPWWCRGPHCQTLYPHVFRRRPALQLERERLELPDGDFLDLAWSGRESGPVVVILHGLEGSLRSHYAAGLVSALAHRGYRTAFLHFRNTTEPNRLPRSYHSGETGDLAHLIRHVAARTGRPPFAAVGYSLGGNVLLKWLGESGESAPLATAAAVSVPFDLGEAADRMERGISRLYQWRLVASLRGSYRRKFSRIPSPLAVDLRRLRTFRQFDDQVTAPLHGFAGVDDYYRRSSSRPFLARIRVPTLIVHARDDPFMWPHTAPLPEQLSPSVRLEISDHGGHVGFVAGPWPWRPRWWLEERIVAHLDGHRFL
jgi:predicted alpha/beta-fold hydrolase